MSRIIAGAARGRRLVVPAGSRTRPTTDRVREAMFSTIESMLGSWDDARVLDLYAGSGALGLEALSRGAQWCTFVERDRRAVAALRANVAATGLRANDVRVDDVGRVVGRRPRETVDVVLADPPYDLPAAEVADVLAVLLGAGWLSEGAVLVVERPAREPPPPWPARLQVDQERRYGETRLWYLREADDHDRRAG